MTRLIDRVRSLRASAFFVVGGKMRSNELVTAIKQVSDQKGLDTSTVLVKVESAIASALRKDDLQYADINVKINEDTSHITAERVYKVMPYEEIEDDEIEVAPDRAKDMGFASAKIGDVIAEAIEQERVDEAGRVAAQTAKQVVSQGLREAEREAVFEEFSHKEGELPSVGDLRVKGNLIVDGTSTTINTSTLTVEDNIIELNRNISSNSGMPNYTGIKVNRGNASTATEQDLFWVWDETFADDGSTTYGNAGGAWTAFKSTDVGGTEMSAPTLVDIRANVVHATSTTAMYADLAERYEADCDTEVGDVVVLGGDAEITKCKDELSNAVFGVISESPAFLMNAQAGNNDSHPMVALQGRVMVKLQGTGKAGDRVVSAGDGEARVANPEECTAFNVLGRLIKHKYNEETALTECVIGVK